MSRTELVTEPARLEALRPAWRDLYAACPAATPFQSPTWLWPWWRAFGEGRLATLATYDDDARLIGLAPLYVYAGDGRPRVLLIGSGNTDYLDVLIRPGREAAVLASWATTPVLAHEVELQQLAPSSVWRSGAPPAGGRFEAQDACPYVPYDEALRTQPVFKAAAYEWRRAARKGAVTITRATPTSANEHFDALVDFHGARWGERGQDGVLHDPRTRHFLREAVAGFAADGTLYMTSLFFDGLRVATLLGFVRQTRAYLYLTGFDPSAAKLSPSKLLMWRMIEDTAAGGVRELDLLRGQEAYKYRWGAVDRWNHRWVRSATQRPAPALVSTGAAARAEPLSSEAGW